jgi:hypothetical protein
MNLDALLDKFPWHETFRALCQEPPSEGSLQLTDAQQLIGQQRASQLAVLSRMMYSPLLEGNYERAKNSSEQGDYLRMASRRLRRPDQASRLFLAAAAQAGKALRPFGPERLSELDRDDAALGRLLVVLSVAQSSPRSRAAYAHEWPEIARQGFESRQSSPFGTVLTPMLFGAEFHARGPIRPNYSVLVGRLVTELRETTSGGDRLAGWTRSLVRAGAARLRRLRRSSRAALIAQLSALKRQDIDDPDVDLWIGVFRSDTETMAAALNAGADVDVTIDEVLRRHRHRL